MIRIFEEFAIQAKLFTLLLPLKVDINELVVRFHAQSV